MKPLLLCLMVITTGQYAYGQLTDSYIELKPGDTLPDLCLPFSISNQPGSLQFSDLKGQFVILDFWDINCTACIKAMPEMDSLQQEFKSKLKILLVTQNSKEEVDRLFSRISIKMPDLISITGDTILNKFFPHLGDPYHVWIDESGKVLHRTFGYNTNKETLQNIFNGQSLSLGERAELVDSGQALLTDGAGSLRQHVLFSSLLVKGYHEFSRHIMNQLSPQEKIHDSSLILTLRNLSILQLYSYLYSKKLYGIELVNNNWIITEVKNKGSLVRPLNRDLIDEWRANNIYNYELIIPVEEAAKKYDIMLDELNRFFAIEGIIERRKVTCWVLTKEKDIPLKCSDTKPQITYSAASGFHAKNIPLSAFIKKFIVTRQYTDTLTILDETHYSANTDIDLNCSLSDTNNLQKELKRNGLKLSKAIRETEVLVLKDKN